MKRPRRLLVRAAVMACAVLAALLLLELGVRVAAGRLYPQILALDHALGWRHAPGKSRTFVDPDGAEVQVAINALGLRGPLPEPVSAAGRARVLVLGDSFTAGTQIPEADLFTARLASPALEVINAGVGGWGTVQEYLYLREEGLDLHPDVTLVMFYGNDLDDNCVAYFPGIGPRPYALLEGDAVRIVEDYPDADYLDFCPPLPMRSFLFRNSALYRSFDKNVWQKLYRRELQELDWRRKGAIAPATRLAVLLGVLAEMRALTRANGVTLAVALIPGREEVRGEAASDHARILDECRRLDIPALSLVEALRAAVAGGSRAYFDTDIHWTRQGHRIAAEALRPFVERLCRERPR